MKGEGCGLAERNAPGQSNIIVAQVAAGFKR
jgi:hypothetical protein